MDKNLIRESYNKIAEQYSEQRDVFKSNVYLEKLVTLLKPGSKVLDIGCGAGVPIDQFLVKHGHEVIGVDISEKQVALAQKNVPQAQYQVKDMSQIQESDYQVDAVVSFYAIFHIPREEHQILFKKINSFLPQGGLILVTMGSGDWEGNDEDFYGTKMSWSHYGPEQNRKIVEENGFTILLDEIDTSGEEKHQVLMARKMV